MRYLLFNIGKPYTDAWWARHISMGVISTGFDNAVDDRGDRILHDLQEGDWIIAYANRHGAIGAGIVAGDETYRLVDRSELPADFESRHRHFRSVDWVYYVVSLTDAVPYPELHLSTAPRHTKTDLADHDNARRIINFLAAKSVKNRNGIAESSGDYFFYNTDAKSMGGERRFSVLLQHGFAATSGPRSFGEQLGQLSPGDTLLMYENGLGVVAIGTVLECWDGQSHATPVYYLRGVGGFHDSGHEYRIQVDWFLDLAKNPITVAEIKKHIGATPRGAVKRIVKRRAEVARMIDGFRLPPLLQREANELPTPDRIATTTYRIVRDTEKARRVKRLHRYECQICGHTIQLPNGSRYSEGHHIQPLGSPHNGPDVIENILCVCPNHHAELDYGVAPINLSTLHTSKCHPIAPQFIEYHNEEIYKVKGE